MLDYAQARRLMVDCQLRTFDVNDIPVLDAFEAVPRERFVPQGREDFAYIDQSLRITGQDPATSDRAVPAPMILARMIQALQLAPGQVALDVATGYGYAAAIMRQLGVRVVALESDETLAAEAESRLSGTDGIEIVHGPLQEGGGEGGAVRRDPRERPRRDEASIPPRPVEGGRTPRLRDGSRQGREGHPVHQDRGCFRSAAALRRLASGPLGVQRGFAFFVLAAGAGVAFMRHCAINLAPNPSPPMP